MLREETGLLQKAFASQGRHTQSKDWESSPNTSLIAPFAQQEKALGIFCASQ